MSFRFEEFADAASAQAAFEAAFPAGSPADRTLQALVDMGAQCRSAGAGRVACRYIEKFAALTGRCWHVGIEAAADKTVERTRIELVMMGP